MRLLNRLFETRAMTIDADPGRLHDAREWAERAAIAAGFDEADCYQVKVAMSEAVANAIQHGSRAPTDRIEIEVFEDDGKLVFEVRDNGTFVAPLARATDEDESGRGLELVTLVMDEVQMTSTTDGSLLRFSKAIAARESV
jgi:anti-sigma regulatory factor (Ser/Thr protein kinase)